MSDSLREGEVTLPFDPAKRATDAGLVFIGRIRTAWSDRADCPKNLRQARASGAPARLEIAADYRPGLKDLAGASHIYVLYWLHRARRDIILQAPRHASDTRGVFSVRSPVRPNPIGLAAVRMLSCDVAAGVIEIDAIDCLDGTPLLDVKPYLPSVDAILDAVMPERLP